LTATDIETARSEELLDIDCGRCGRTLRVRLTDLGNARFVGVQHEVGVCCF
jgi:hypothetical protein